LEMNRNIALAIHTDDYVIWFTEGEDPRVTSAARRGNLALVRGDYITPTYHLW